jgi:hypothetical protein
VSSLFEFHLFLQWFLLVPFYRHAAAAAAAVSKFNLLMVWLVVTL